MTTRLCCSYLRVYRPRSSLSAVEDGRWASSSVGGSAPSLQLLAPEECLDVYEKVVEGEPYVCPSSVRLRILQGLIAFEHSLPDAAVPFFFTEEEISDARRELADIEREHPGLSPAIIQSLWHVPPRWFVCFDDAERRIEQRGDHPTIRYETDIEHARARVSDALQTLTGGIVHPVIVGMIYELKEWLKGFGDRAVIELDYASVATMFDPDDLADDHSAADVWGAIAALGEGDGMRAGQCYRRVNERWSRARDRGALN